MSIRAVSYLPWFLAAAMVHAGLIFAWRKVIDPHPEYGIDRGESIDITLVESAPVPAEETAIEPSVIPEAQVAPPPPEPDPQPMPELAPAPEAAVIEAPPPPAAKPNASAFSPARRVGPSAQPGGEKANRESGTAPGARTNAKPNYLSNPPPAYPVASKVAHEEGIVLLTVAVNAQGRVDSVRLRRSSGFSRLDQAALRAVRSWRFSPARIGGVAVSSEAQVPVRFQLD